MDLLTFDKQDDFIEAATKIVQQVCSQNSENITIALSGGSTPKPVYQEIANNPEIPLKYVEIYQVDERYITAADPKSNQHLLQNTVLSNSENQPKGTHFFDTSLPIEQSLQAYEKELPVAPFDLIILGIGPDGHTASLFPGLTALDEEERTVAYTTTEEFDVFDRLTLTFPPILKAKKLLLLLKGSSKQAVIDELQEGPLEFREYPAKKLLEHPDLTILYDKND